MTPNSTQVNFDPQNPTDWEKSTYYSRDAQGNIMAIYEYTVVDSTQQNNYTLTERNIYGSDRLGNNHEPIEMIAAPPVDTSKYTHHVGYRQYELSNHLGNVMSVISDRKIARDTSANDTVDYYEPDVLLTFDYSPFGAPLHARSFSKEVCRDTTFNMLVEDLNTNFDDGTTMGWLPLSSTTQLSVNNGGRLRVKKQGGGSGTLGVKKTFNATAGTVYTFSIRVKNKINPGSIVKVRIKDPNNNLIFTQDVTYDPNNPPVLITHQFTANITGTYKIKVKRTGNNANGRFLMDDVLVTHEEEVNELVCEDYEGYRYGFNGQEKDNEISGAGNMYAYTFRLYNSRLGRFFVIDPIYAKFPHNSPFAFSENRVIDGVELEGLEVHLLNDGNKIYGPFDAEYIEKHGTLYNITTDMYMQFKNAGAYEEAMGVIISNYQLYKISPNYKLNSNERLGADFVTSGQLGLGEIQTITYNPNKMPTEEINYLANYIIGLSHEFIHVDQRSGEEIIPDHQEREFLAYTFSALPNKSILQDRMEKNKDFIWDVNFEEPSLKDYFTNEAIRRYNLLEPEQQNKYVDYYNQLLKVREELDAAEEEMEEMDFENFEIDE